MGPHGHADQRFARFVRHSTGDHAAFDHTDRHVFAYAMNAVFDRQISEDISRRPSIKDISCWRETDHFEISVVVDRRRMATSEPFADLVGEDSRVRHRLTVGAGGCCAKAIRANAAQRRINIGVITCFIASIGVGQTSWERRHPCLLASVSRSLPETPQARMPALPGSLPYLRAGSRVNITVVSAPLLTVTRRLTALAPGASFHSFWLTLTIGMSVNSYSPGANLSITNRPFPSAVAPLPPESKAG